MNQSLPRSVFILTILILAGCSSKGDVKVARTEPSRTIEANFPGMSISQAKNSIMAACSESRLQIHTTQTEVTCAQNDISGWRKRDLDQFVNDEYATNLQIVRQFKLTELGGNVSATANTYVQYLAPVSLSSGPQTRTRNMVDDISYKELSALVERAGIAAGSVK